MRLTSYGHATFAVEAGGKTLLFDPFITPNPLAEKIDLQKVKADFILVPTVTATTSPTSSSSPDKPAPSSSRPSKSAPGSKKKKALKTSRA